MLLFNLGTSTCFGSSNCYIWTASRIPLLNSAAALVGSDHLYIVFASTDSVPSTGRNKIQYKDSKLTGYITSASLAELLVIAQWLTITPRLAHSNTKERALNHKFHLSSRWNKGARRESCTCCQQKSSMLAASGKYYCRQQLQIGATRESGWRTEAFPQALLPIFTGDSAPHAREFELRPSKHLLLGGRADFLLITGLIGHNRRIFI